MDREVGSEPLFTQRALDRNCNEEYAAFAHLAFNPDPSAVGLCDKLAECQPQTSGVFAAGRARLDLTELLEDPPERFRRDSFAGVADGEKDCAVALTSRNVHHAARSAELDGVAQQVDEGAHQLVDIRGNRWQERS